MVPVPQRRSVAWSASPCYDKNFFAGSLSAASSRQRGWPKSSPPRVRNYRLAETEKYAHVTYFFNGGVEQEFPLRDVAVPSPRVATYD